MPKFYVDLFDGTPQPDDRIIVVFGDEEYVCTDVLPVSALAEYNAIMSASLAAVAFMRRVLRPADLDRFEALLGDKDRVLNADELGKAVKWLMETYTGRPTRRSSDSSDGPMRNGSSSEAISILRESPSPTSASETVAGS